VQQLADDAGIGCSRLNSVRELAEHPQLAVRKRWQEVGTPGGPVPVLRHPAVGLDWELRRGAVPTLGQHTDAIRAEVAVATSGATPTDAGGDR
jgi:crotonobetainyl-CoA:carnitine CoA-transferase CaiB-like acyl-CoA transferase